MICVLVACVFILLPCSLSLAAAHLVLVRPLGTKLPRYVALLRGVSPANLKMPDLKRCLEIAGYAKVKTVLSSGNVAFDSASGSFYTIVRSVEYLNDLIEADPYADFDLPTDAKRVVTFARKLPSP